MKLDSLSRREPGFLEPMECLAVSQIPDGSNWGYEIKLDGYRAVAINSNGRLVLFSKNCKSFNRQYPYIGVSIGGLTSEDKPDEPLHHNSFVIYRRGEP